MHPSLKIMTGDLFASRLQTIVNTINCKGVMGAGIALRCKQLYPEVFTDYRERCDAGSVRVGEPYLYRRVRQPWVVNFPTKNHWRNPSKLHYITDGLEYLAAHYEGWGITSLAFPALGCGNGGLHWSEVGPEMYHVLKDFAIPIEIYVPLDVPAVQREEAFLRKSERAISSPPPVQTDLWGDESTPVTQYQPKKRTRRR